jgi:uncharacterized protein (DUF934 family)
VSAAGDRAVASASQPAAPATLARPLPGRLTLRLVDPMADPWRAGPELPAASATAAPSTPPAPLDPRAPVRLGWSQWQARRAGWPEGILAGVRLPNDVDPALLAEDLDRLALVELEFPKWTDGRAYSQAHLLRRRWGYRGELRAVGDVLVDMLPLLARTGFDAALLRAGQSRAAAERALGFFDLGYQ